MIQRRELPRRLGVLAHRVVKLRRQHHVVAATAGERPANDLLGLACAIDVGGVDEVDAGVQRRVDDLDRLVVVGVAPRAEHHGAEAEAADLNAGAPERPKFHRGAPGRIESRRARAATAGRRPR